MARWWWGVYSNRSVDIKTKNQRGIKENLEGKTGRRRWRSYFRVFNFLFDTRPQKMVHINQEISIRFQLVLPCFSFNLSTHPLRRAITVKCTLNVIKWINFFERDENKKPIRIYKRNPSHLKVIRATPTYATLELRKKEEKDAPRHDFCFCFLKWRIETPNERLFEYIVNFKFSLPPIKT